MIDHDRVTDRITFSLVRLELRRAAAPLVVLIIGFAAAAAAAEYILSHINGGVGSTHTVRFAVDDATGVVPERAEVRFQGIEAGTITSVQLVGGHPVLTATIADKFGPVYRNVQASLRPNTPLQDMYLDITNRGTPTAGTIPAGWVVPDTQTRTPVNLADVLNTFQPDVRTQLYNLIDQLGNGLADHGQDLRTAFVQVVPFLKIAGRISDQLAERATLTGQLVHRTADLTGVLAGRSRQLRRLIASGTSMLEALSTKNGAAMRATINELPGTLTAAHILLNAGSSFLPQLDKATASLEPVTAELPSGLRNLSVLAASADPAVRRLIAPVTQLVPLAETLKPFSSDLSTSLTRIAPQVTDVDTITRDAAACVPWINEFFNWDDSMLKLYDNYGNPARGTANFGFYSVPTVKQSNYTYGYQCAGGAPIENVPTPKYAGPPPMP